MPNTIVPAAGEAMPAANINRRRMLLGLAAASTAAATISIVTDAAPAENPELIRLADELPAIEARYIAADKHERHLQQKYEPQWPLAPDEITRPGSRHAWGGFERGFKGGALYRKGEERPRQLIPASTYEWEIKRARWALKGNKLEKRKIQGLNREQWEAELTEAERLYPVAAHYEAEIARIAEESNYEAAWKNTAATVEALEIHVATIMNQPDSTMHGLIIKAQALAAWGRVKGFHKLAFRHGQEWPGQIAAASLRHAEGGAA